MSRRKKNRNRRGIKTQKPPAQPPDLDWERIWNEVQALRPKNRPYPCALVSPNGAHCEVGLCGILVDLSWGETRMPYGQYRNYFIKDIPRDYLETIADGVDFAMSLRAYLKTLASAGRQDNHR